MRTFLIERIGSGSLEDPWRPAYVDGTGIKWSAVDGGDHFIVEVTGDDKQLAALAVQPGVADLTGDRVVSVKEIAAIRAFAPRLEMAVDAKPMALSEVVRAIKSEALLKQRIAADAERLIRTDGKRRG